MFIIVMQNFVFIHVIYYYTPTGGSNPDMQKIEKCFYSVL